MMPCLSYPTAANNLNNYTDIDANKHKFKKELNAKLSLMRLLMELYIQKTRR